MNNQESHCQELYNGAKNGVGYKQGVIHMSFNVFWMKWPKEQISEIKNYINMFKTNLFSSWGSWVTQK